MLTDGCDLRHGAACRACSFGLWRSGAALRDPIAASSGRRSSCGLEPGRSACPRGDGGPTQSTLRGSRSFGVISRSQSLSIEARFRIFAASEQTQVLSPIGFVCAFFAYCGLSRSLRPDLSAVT